MEWIADPCPGGWLRERPDDGYAAMHVAVPRGLPAHARVFHPAFVRSLPMPIVEGADLTWTADEVNR